MGLPHLRDLIPLTKKPQLYFRTFWYISDVSKRSWALIFFHIWRVWETVRHAKLFASWCFLLFLAILELYIGSCEFLNPSSVLERMLLNPSWVLEWKNTPISEVNRSLSSCFTTHALLHHSETHFQKLSMSQEPHNSFYFKNHKLFMYWILMINKFHFEQFCSVYTLAAQLRNTNVCRTLSGHRGFAIKPSKHIPLYTYMYP